MKPKLEYKIGDCLKLLPNIPDKSIDMILCDLPYGTTQNKWDSIIPLNLLWAQYKRIIKTNGVIVLTSMQPFTSELVHSNRDMFKYEWIWEKTQGTGFLNAKKQPLRNHEEILVFYTKQPTYNPQMWISKPYTTKRKDKSYSNNYGKQRCVDTINETGLRYPLSIQTFGYDKEKLHPTQKPIGLWEYLIKTYTNEGDTVHDSCLGSGTTLKACKNTRRNCIGFEISNEWEPIYKDIMLL